MNKLRINYFATVFFCIALIGCNEETKPSAPKAVERPVERLPIEKVWKYNIDNGKKVSTINLISDYSDLGDLIISCDTGSSSIEFISAKPIGEKARLAYTSSNSKRVPLNWKIYKENGFTNFKSDKKNHIPFLKDLYSGTNLRLAVIDPNGYNNEIKISNIGFKDSISATKLICGWKDSDFIP